MTCAIGASTDEYAVFLEVDAKGSSSRSTSISQVGRQSSMPDRSGTTASSSWTPGFVAAKRAQPWPLEKSVTRGSVDA
jgi:hypothetical protein